MLLGNWNAGVCQLMSLYVSVGQQECHCLLVQARRNVNVTVCQCRPEGMSLSASVCQKERHCLPVQARKNVTVCQCRPVGMSLSASVGQKERHCLPVQVRRNVTVCQCRQEGMSLSACEDHEFLNLHRPERLSICVYIGQKEYLCLSVQARRHIPDCMYREEEMSMSACVGQKDFVFVCMCRLEGKSLSACVDQRNVNVCLCRQEECHWLSVQTRMNVTVCQCRPEGMSLSAFVLSVQARRNATFQVKRNIRGGCKGQREYCIYICLYRSEGISMFVCISQKAYNCVYVQGRRDVNVCL